MKKIEKYLLYLLFAISYSLLAIYSYGLVDANFPLKVPALLSEMVRFPRWRSAGIYVFLISLLFISYFRALWLVKKRHLVAKQIWSLIILSVVILFFAFPAFSYDIFNYMATARVTFLYRENPYLVMPIEISNEPMLKFMHAANKTALYGPFWILLTAIPHFLGQGNLVLTVFVFKAFVILFYLALAWLIWRLSSHHLLALTFFALNPLVIVNTLVDGHNDVVMMALALLAFLFLQKKKFFMAGVMVLASILIKFATFLLLPVWAWLIFAQWWQQKINWQKIWLVSTLALLLIFLLSPLREEIYAWYLIWPLTTAAFLSPGYWLVAILLGFSFGLMFRIVPFLYFGTWGGLTPLIKKTVSFLPPLLGLLFLQIKKLVKQGD